MKEADVATDTNEFMQCWIAGSGELYGLVSRDGWARGPWDGEPDGLVWESSHGFRCALARGPTGAWCGYVALKENHPLFGVAYHEVEVKVHGGLTFGEILPDKLWALGFDCAHSFDLVPFMPLHLDPMKWITGFLDSALELEPGDDTSCYRTMEWAKAETERLAEQLAVKP